MVIPQPSLRHLAVTNPITSSSLPVISDQVINPLPRSFKAMKTRPVCLLMKPTEHVHFPPFKSRVGLSAASKTPTLTRMEELSCFRGGDEPPKTPTPSSVEELSCFRGGDEPSLLSPVRLLMKPAADPVKTPTPSSVEDLSCFREGDEPSLLSDVSSIPLCSIHVIAQPCNTTLLTHGLV